MESRKACFRVESSRDTGEVMLLIGTACGFRPVMAWPDTVQLKEFAEMLMGVCESIDRGNISGDIPESFLKGFGEEK